MSELESILNHLETTSLEPHDDYTSEFSYKSQKILWVYIKHLQEENKELRDNNLYFKCHIKNVEQRVSFLKAQLEQTNKVLNTSIIQKDRYKKTIDKAIEYIEQHAITVTDGTVTTNKHELLEILKEVK